LFEPDNRIRDILGLRLDDLRYTVDLEREGYALTRGVVMIDQPDTGIAGLAYSAFAQGLKLDGNLAASEMIQEFLLITRAERYGFEIDCGCHASVLEPFQ
jgi:hypothetical protein